MGSRRSLGRFTRPIGRRRLIFDIVVAVVFGLICLVAAVGQGVLAIVVLVILCVALAIYRLAPGPALAIAWVGAILQMAVSLAASPSDLAILPVLYATAAHGSRAVRWAGFVSAIVGSVIGGIYLAVLGPGTSLGADTTPVRITMTVGFFIVGLIAVLGLSWTLGLLSRTRRLAAEGRIQARLDAERSDYEVAVEQERTRIARDMHDVVAHSLAVVIAQADGARYAAAGNPDAAPQALGTIATTARAALSDVRMLLAELRQDSSDSPQPTLAELDGLFAQLEAAGLRITRTESGAPRPLGAAREMAAFRIVQEALTNALRHGGDTVAVGLDWGEDALVIDVVNRLRRDEASGSPGHGLAGMRERAALVGGTFEAGSGDGSFTVHATIPVPVPIPEEGP